MRRLLQLGFVLSAGHFGFWWLIDRSFPVGTAIYFTWATLLALLIDACLSATPKGNENAKR